MSNDLRQYTLPEIFAAALYASRIRDKDAALEVGMDTLRKLKEAREDNHDDR